MAAHLSHPAVRPALKAIGAGLSIAALLLTACHAASAASPGGVYLIDDGGDTIRLSDQAWLPEARLVAAVGTTDPDETRPATVARRIDSSWSALIDASARRHRVAPELLHAIIWVESGNAPRAVSPRGAQGLMQLMPTTARAYGVTDPFDPAQNIEAGARHMRHLLDRFGQDMRLALAAYNAGAAAVARNGNTIPPFAETLAYVPRVLAGFDRLRQASDQPGPASVH